MPGLTWPLECGVAASVRLNESLKLFGPVVVKLKLRELPDGFVTLSVMISAQRLKEPDAKSFKTALSASDDRVSARKLWRQGRLSFPPKRVVRSTPPSKNAPVGNVPALPDFGVYYQGAAVAPELTIAQALSSAVHPVLVAS